MQLSVLPDFATPKKNLRSRCLAIDTNRQLMLCNTAKSIFQYQFLIFQSQVPDKPPRQTKIKEKKEKRRQTKSQHLATSTVWLTFGKKNDSMCGSRSFNPLAMHFNGTNVTFGEGWGLLTPVEDRTEGRRVKMEKKC